MAGSVDITGKQYYPMAIGHRQLTPTNEQAPAPAPVTITGVSGLNQVVTAIIGAGWTYSSIQWRRNVSGSVSDISGATSLTYTQQAADVVPGVIIFPSVTGLTYAASGLTAPAVTAAASVTAYLGPVANGARIFNKLSVGGTYQNIEYEGAMYATENIATSGISLTWLNGGINDVTLVEAGSGGTMTIKASVEYNGTRYQCLWAGQPSVTVASGVETPFFDTLYIPCPVGGKLIVRTNAACAGGAMFYRASTAGLDSANGAAFNNSASALTDKTMSGSVTNRSGNTADTFPPFRCRGLTTRPTIGQIGDSRLDGIRDTWSAQGMRGQAERSIYAAGLATINASCAGDKAQSFVASNTYRRLQVSDCTHIFCNYGINDLAQTTATIQGYLQTIWGYCTGAGKKVYQLTITPYTTGTANNADGSDQTLVPNYVSNIMPLNTALLASPAGVNAVFDVNSAVSLANGKWKAPGYVYTDLLHELALGNQTIFSSGVINMGLIAYP